jgi:hypothetical protein
MFLTLRLWKEQGESVCEIGAHCSTTSANPRPTARLRRYSPGGPPASKVCDAMVHPMPDNAHVSGVAHPRRP